MQQAESGRASQNSRISRIAEWERLQNIQTRELFNLIFPWSMQQLPVWSESNRIAVSWSRSLITTSMAGVCPAMSRSPSVLLSQGSSKLSPVTRFTFCSSARSSLNLISAKGFFDCSVSVLLYFFFKRLIRKADGMCRHTPHDGAQIPWTGLRSCVLSAVLVLSWPLATLVDHFWPRLCWKKTLKHRAVKCKHINAMLRVRLEMHKIQDVP